MATHRQRARFHWPRWELETLVQGGGSEAGENRSTWAGKLRGRVDWTGGEEWRVGWVSSSGWVGSQAPPEGWHEGHGHGDGRGRLGWKWAEDQWVESGLGGKPHNCPEDLQNSEIWVQHLSVASRCLGKWLSVSLSLSLRACAREGDSSHHFQLRSWRAKS